MSTYSQALDQLVELCEAKIGVPATRDPSAVIGLVSSGGCVLVGMPNVIARLLSGANLEIPVSLVAPAPPDIRAVDWLLEHVEGLLDVAGARTVRNGPIEIGSTTFPAVTAMAQVALKTV